MTVLELFASVRVPRKRQREYRPETARCPERTRASENQNLPIAKGPICDPVFFAVGNLLINQLRFRMLRLEMRHKCEIEDPEALPNGLVRVNCGVVYYPVCL